MFGFYGLIVYLDSCVSFYYGSNDMLFHPSPYSCQATRTSGAISRSREQFDSGSSAWAGLPLPQATHTYILSRFTIRPLVYTMQTSKLTLTASHSSQPVSGQTPRPLHSSASQPDSNTSSSLLPNVDATGITEEDLRHAEVKLEAKCVLDFGISMHAVGFGHMRVDR